MSNKITQCPTCGKYSMDQQEEIDTLCKLLEIEKSKVSSLRALRDELSDRLSAWKNAYTNLRDYCESKGWDITARRKKCE